MLRCWYWLVCFIWAWLGVLKCRAIIFLTLSFSSVLSLCGAMIVSMTSPNIFSSCAGVICVWLGLCWGFLFLFSIFCGWCWLLAAFVFPLFGIWGLGGGSNSSFLSLLLFHSFSFCLLIASILDLCFKKAGHIL